MKKKIKILIYRHEGYETGQRNELCVSGSPHRDFNQVLKSRVPDEYAKPVFLRYRNQDNNN